MTSKGPDVERVQEPNGKVENAVQFVEKGCKLTKIGTNGKKYRRHFFVDRKFMALCYNGSRKQSSMQRWVPIKDMVEVVVDSDAGGKAQQGKVPATFTLVVGKDSKKLKTLIAPSQEVRNTWATGLRHLVSVRSVDDPVQQERMWLEECFANADQNRDDFLDRDEIADLIQSLNVTPMATRDIRTRVQSQRIDFDGFVALYSELSRKNELDELFHRYSGSQQSMTVTELGEFFRKEQNEEMSADTLRNIIAWSEPCPELKDRGLLSLAGFAVMFTSNRMNVKNPQCLTVYQDMTQPLSHYFVNSSHNTYLEGNQATGLSHVEQYKLALSTGCRCIELDVWDGDNGQPIIYHGYTLTSKLLLSHVLEAINEHAFKENEQAVIISLENHASERQQARVAELLRKTFKDRLYFKPLCQDDDISLPSPSELKGRVIVQGRKPSDSDPEDSDDEAPGDVEVSEIDRQRHREKKEVKVKPAVELADCVSFYQAQPFKSFEESSAKLRFLNISETKVGNCLAPDGGRQFVDFNVQKLTRVYPAWWRLSSSNYNPIPMWTAGCQTRDESLILNDGLFEDNGHCGYVLKPAFMRCERTDYGPDLPQPADRARVLTVQIISGYMLPKEPGDDNDDILDPYVQVEIHGIEADRKVHWTEVVRNNGFNPVWNETKRFTVTCPDVALVLFRVVNSWTILRDVTVAEYCLPMRCMQTGYRMIALRDRHGDKIGPTGLFVRISIDKMDA